MNNSIFLTVFIILNLFSIQLNSQCQIEQSSDSGFGVNPNFGGGQSFIACSSGLLEEVEFKSGAPWGTSPFDLELKDSDCNVIWTASGTGGNNQTIQVDLSSGSGITRNLVMGQAYSVGIPGSGHSFKFEDGNVYADGAFITQFDFCFGADATRDLWFRLSIGQALPVELLEFKSALIQDRVKLYWSTANEVNNQGFKIQKSTNGREWKTIDFIKGHGTTYKLQEYQYEDKSPSSGINYYRLKQIDFDGAFEYSKIVSTTVLNDKQVTIHPNPTNGKLEFSGIDEAEITISDNQGRIAKSLTQTNSNIDISELPNGLYFISFKTKSGIITKRIIKE